MAVTGPRYDTPPTLDLGFKADLDYLVQVVNSNATAIAEKLLFNAVVEAGVTAPKVSIPPLVKMIESIIEPVLQKFEGGWSDHPSDSGGATMRGIILPTFTNNFDYLLISTAIPAVKTAAESLNRKYPGWKTDPSKSRQALYVVAGDAKVASIWIKKFFADKNCRYPIAVMTEDPFLGYFFMECCWGSGPGGYNNSGFDAIFREYGWNGSVSQFVPFIASLGNKTPELATKIVQRRLQFILDISAATKSNSIFRKGWLNRLINDPTNSNIALMVKINELFNLNSKGQFQLSRGELKHLKIKAEIYKTFSISVP